MHDTVKMTRLRVTLLLLPVLFGFTGLLALRQWRLSVQPPDEVALDYARAVYARDYSTAWKFISAEDKEVKSRQAYLAENASFTGLEQEMAYTLAGWIQFTATDVQIADNQAIVTMHIKTPNGNQAEVYEILQAARREGKVMAAERQALLDRLQALYAGGQLEILEGEQTFTLVREWAGWRMRLGWADAVVVKLTAEVSPDLPWEFYPLQTEVRALPGETLTAVYRATNNSDQAITGKARHFILPEEHEQHITSIQCFCFIQQTLGPGETIDMKLIFRLDYDIPANVRQLENKYVFYTLESFPEEARHDD